MLSVKLSRAVRAYGIAAIRTVAERGTEFAGENISGVQSV
jgi:hypothetical protein